MKKVSFPIIPRNHARKRTPRQRIVFRKPKPPEKKRIPIVEPTPKFIPVRICQLWSTDEESEIKRDSDMDSLISTGSVSDETVFEENEIDVDSIIDDIESIKDDRDLSVDHFGIIQSLIREFDIDLPIQNETVENVGMPKTPIEQSFRRRFASADQIDITENTSELAELNRKEESVRRWKFGREKLSTTVSHFDRVSGELVGVNGLPISRIENDNEDRVHNSGSLMDRIPSLSEENSEYSSTEDVLNDMPKLKIGDISTLRDSDDISNEQTKLCGDTESRTEQNSDLNGLSSLNQSDLVSEESTIVDNDVKDDDSIQRFSRPCFYAIETCIVTSQSPK
jgi:hypothetical protein